MRTAKLTTTLRASHSGPAMLQVFGEVDLSNAAELRERLTDVIDAGHRRLVIDLSGMSFCDATGLDALLTGRRRMCDHGGWLCLCGMQPIVAKIFRITALNDAFTVYATPQEALRAGPRGRTGTARRHLGRRLAKLPRYSPLPSRCSRSGERRTGLLTPEWRATAANSLRHLVRAWSKMCRAVRRLRAAVAGAHPAGPWPVTALARSVSTAVRRGGALGGSPIRHAS